MRITLNGQRLDLPGPMTLSALAESVSSTPPAAILVNGKPIPRSSHDTTLLREDDVIDIVPLPPGG
jgi:thiamine biosynthesis protein ThiS